MNYPGIYVITNIESGRKYIGSAVDIKNRWSVHLCHLNSGKHHSKKLQRAWDKYGSELFSFSVLERVNDVNLLIEREQFYIDQLTCIKSSYNCNPKAGSSLGRKFSEETRRKFTLQRTGLKASNETRIKMSLAKKGKKKTPEHAAKLIANLRASAKKGLSEETRNRMSNSAKNRVQRSFRGKDGKFLSGGEKCYLDI